VNKLLEVTPNQAAHTHKELFSMESVFSFQSPDF